MTENNKEMGVNMNPYTHVLANTITIMTSYYILDGLCIKSRKRDPSKITPEEIEEIIREKKNTAIQIGDQVTWYTTQNMYNIFIKQMSLNESAQKYWKHISGNVTFVLNDTFTEKIYSE